MFHDAPWNGEFPHAFNRGVRAKRNEDENSCHMLQSSKWELSIFTPIKSEITVRQISMMSKAKATRFFPFLGIAKPNPSSATSYQYSGTCYTAQTRGQNPIATKGPVSQTRPKGDS